MFALLSRSATIISIFSNFARRSINYITLLSKAAESKFYMRDGFQNRRCLQLHHTEATLLQDS